MATGSDSPAGGDDPLSAIRSAPDLDTLRTALGVETVHDAYRAAKRTWADRPEELLAPTTTDPPGDCVTVGGHEFCVHGITHADTDAERAYLREHVDQFLDAGATVYCEQGIRSMYFADRAGVCEMDDYAWAMRACQQLDVESHVSGLPDGEFAGIVEDVDSLTAAFQDAVFSLVDSGGDHLGERFEQTLGAVASNFLTSHEDLATGDDFESFRKTRAAAEDPDLLVDLQTYYKRTFLPQPLEREWLARHDPELELVTHARNERMADYAVYHNDDAERVHLIVGAAHQPGVTYYLESHRDGERDASGFELAG